MPRASISHIALTVSDLDRSTEFYDKIFKFMGYLRTQVPESTQRAMRTSRVSLRAGRQTETLLA